MKKGIYVVAVLLGAMGAAQAATDNYLYNHFIDTDGTQAWGHSTSILADGAGGIYFTDNFDDTILSSDNPLTDALPTDITIVSDTEASFGSFSYQGIAFDGTNFYAAGDNGGTSNLIQFTPNVAPPGTPTAWTRTLIPMPAGRYAGVTAVGANKLVMTDRLTGALNFFTVTGATIALDGTTATSPGVPTTSLTANSNTAPTKIFVCGPGAGSGAVYVYNTNGTLAGTSYSAGSNPLYAGETSSIAGTSNPVTYGQVAYNSDNTIAVTVTRGTTGNPSVKLFDVSSSTGPNLSPYLTIDGTSTVGGAWDSTDFIYGVGFFTRASVKYLAVGFEEGPSAGSGASSVLIYGPTAAVGDWTTYQ